MKQYTITNQAFLLVQNPEATDVHPFSYWVEKGRRVKKGEKALKVWVPVARKQKPEGKNLETMTDEERKVYFRTGNVFDISQTETQEEWEARKEEQAKEEVLTQHV